MAAGIGKVMNIKSVEFDVTLDNLKEFKEFWTETFYVRGNPWAVHFEKVDSEEGDVKKKSLSGYLYSKINRTSKNWAIVADFKVEIYSNNYNGKSIFSEFQPHSYFKAIGWGRHKLISWDELMDPERGYVYNDMCKIGINVKASPIQFPNDGKLIEFVPVVKCCDATSRGEFRIKVNEVYNFFDICSPEFILKHFSWRLLICKNATWKNDKKEEMLQVQLINPALDYEKEKSCKVTLLCKLVPFDTAIEPISSKLENKELKRVFCICNLNIISWNELMNPQKKFIQNNSFVLQITIKVTETEEQEAARALEREAKNDKPKAITFECPICFALLVGQPMSVLICGHMYCSDCIAKSLEQKRNCPSCNRDIPEGELQKVYLPTN